MNILDLLESRLSVLLQNKDVDGFLEGVDTPQLSDFEVKFTLARFLNLGPDLALIQNLDLKTKWLSQTSIPGFMVSNMLTKEGKGMEVIRWFLETREANQGSFQLSLQDQNALLKRCVTCGNIEYMFELVKLGVLGDDVVKHSVMNLAHVAFSKKQDTFLLAMKNHGLFSSSHLKENDHALVRFAIHRHTHRFLACLWEDLGSEIIEFCKKNKAWKALDGALPFMCATHQQEALDFLTPLLESKTHQKMLSELPNLHILLEKHHLQQHIHVDSTPSPSRKI